MFIKTIKSQHVFKQLKQGGQDFSVLWAKYFNTLRRRKWSIKTLRDVEGNIRRVPGQTVLQFVQGQDSRFPYSTKTILRLGNINSCKNYQI